MSKPNLKSLPPEERLLWFINERESIRLKKEAGLDKPWTSNEILRKFRFTCVRRMDDKVSQWLYDCWYNPYFDHPNMVAACVLARHFNKPEALGPITHAVFAKQYRASTVLRIIQALKAKGTKVFNAAYMIHADKSADKSEMVINRVVQPFIDNPPKLDTGSMEKCVEEISRYWNMGSFMSGQVVSDLRWAISGTWADRNTWAPIGPGSRRGMNRFYNRELNFNLKQNQFLKELLLVNNMLKFRLPKSITSRMELMDVQNCFCEYDKLCRVLDGEGRPKQLYDGVS